MLSTIAKLHEGSVWTTVPSPVGELILIASNQGLHALFWKSEHLDLILALKRIKADAKHKVLQSTIQQLQEYFQGERTEFDLPLAPYGTPFQIKAWSELRKIPYGQTISYCEQAIRLGDRKKARAVGTANSKNPISIVVPCHRVIAADGRLSGFVGGVKNKQILLALEKRLH